MDFAKESTDVDHHRFSETITVFGNKRLLWNKLFVSQQADK
jgi:hypothetical protein